LGRKERSSHHGFHSVRSRMIRHGAPMPLSSGVAPKGRTCRGCCGDREGGLEQSVIDSLNGALEWMFQSQRGSLTCGGSGETPEDAFLAERTHGTRASLIFPGTYGGGFLEIDAPGDEGLAMPRAADWKDAAESRQVHVHRCVESSALTCTGPAPPLNLQSFFGP